jgi:hypothetical protein
VIWVMEVYAISSFVQHVLTAQQLPTRIANSSLTNSVDKASVNGKFVTNAVSSADGFAGKSTNSNSLWGCSARAVRTSPHSAAEQAALRHHQ